MVGSVITSLAFVILTHFTGQAATTKCETYPPYKYECPGPDHPKTYTECCGEECCPPQTFLETKEEMAEVTLAILKVITFLCFVFIAATLICCFWSKCPLYNTCRAKYNASDTIVYSLSKDEDPLALMPLEGKNGNCYTPCNIKIKKVEDV